MLVKPADLKIETVSEKENTAVFAFEPLPKGFGHTLGNALRRILLTSIEGAAITQTKIDGAKHQFSTISGVKEDMVELGLNFKSIKVKSYVDQPVIATIEKKGPGIVTAKDIQCPSDVEIISKDLHIATLADAKTTFKAELTIERGFGYSPVEERETSKIGVVLLDALFSPVVRVTYEIDAARFGKVTDLDKLILTITTDGSISAKEAVIEASGTLKDFSARFQLWDVVESAVADVLEDVSDTELSTEDMSVADLPLPTRTINALKKQGIKTLHALAKLSDEDLADIKNVGEKSLDEIKKLLDKEGLK